jgi:hypothetical protein
MQVHNAAPAIFSMRHKGRVNATLILVIASVSYRTIHHDWHVKHIKPVQAQAAA